eukprot:s2532_g4.t1
MLVSGTRIVGLALSESAAGIQLESLPDGKPRGERLFAFQVGVGPKLRQPPSSQNPVAEPTNGTSLRWGEKFQAQPREKPMLLLNGSAVSPPRALSRHEKEPIKKWKKETGADLCWCSTVRNRFQFCGLSVISDLPGCDWSDDRTLHGDYPWLPQARQSQLPD